MLFRLVLYPRVMYTKISDKVLKALTNEIKKIENAWITVLSSSVTGHGSMRFQSSCKMS